MSQRFTVVWVGICYLLIQSFGHFILSKCTSSNTAPSVSCETIKLLDAWLFTVGTPYLPPRERPPNDLCLCLGWKTQFEWHRWNCNQLKSSCQRVSVAWVARAMSFVLQQKDCSKFPKQIWKPSVNVLLVTVLRLSGTRCRPTWELGGSPNFQS